MKKIWFITGSSRGLGRAIAETVLAAGHSVIATARRPEQLDDLVAQYGSRILPAALDVTSKPDAEKAVSRAFEAFGRIDVLVNNAGFGSTEAFEDMSPAEFGSHLDTNFWGVVNVTRAALPRLREQGFGHIVQISSIAGRLAVAGMSAYSAAKFAVEGLSESLAQEIQPLGLKLTLVEPGGFRTGFSEAAKSSALPKSAYSATVGAVRDYLSALDGKQPGDPRKAAKVILELVEQENPPLRLPLGSDALAYLRKRYEESLADLIRHEALSRSTDLDGIDLAANGIELLKTG